MGIEDVYKRRESNCMQFDDLCKHFGIKCKHKYDSHGIIVDINPQSKVKESKVEKTKVNIPFDDFWNLYDKKIDRKKG